MTTDFTSGWAYPPSPMKYAGPCKTRRVLMVDQQKQNMVWLAGFDSLADPHPFLDDVHQHMSKDIREKLRELPKAFMAWLYTKPHDTWIMMRNAPPINIFADRARAAQARIIVPDSNVIAVDFKRRNAA